MKRVRSSPLIHRGCEAAGRARKVIHDVVRREHSTCRRGSAPPPLVPDKKVILRPVGNRVFSSVSARPPTDRPTRAANSPAISKAAWAKLFRITRSSNLLLAVALLRLSPILKLVPRHQDDRDGDVVSWNAPGRTPGRSAERPHR